jgi:hypothetical protein
MADDRYSVCLPLSPKTRAAAADHVDCECRIKDLKGIPDDTHRCAPYAYCERSDLKVGETCEFDLQC